MIGVGDLEFDVEDVLAIVGALMLADQLPRAERVGERSRRRSEPSAERSPGGEPEAARGARRPKGGERRRAVRSSLPASVVEVYRWCAAKEGQHHVV